MPQGLDHDAEGGQVLATARVVEKIAGKSFFATAAPVGWGTWLARTLQRDAEAGGGLQVAVIQLAIMAGAAVGGLVFDAYGWQVSFDIAASLLLTAALAAGLAWKYQEVSE